MITACLSCLTTEVQIRNVLCCCCQKLTGKIWEGTKEEGDDQLPKSFVLDSILGDAERKNPE